MPISVLLVEDDKTISEGLKYSLELDKYEVKTVHSFKMTMDLIAKESFDLYILDLMLPDGSGYDLCKAIKAQSDRPVIFLTACDEEINAVMGLDLGADDYITKPFRVRELMSRIKVILKRYSITSNSSIISIGDIEIDTAKATVKKASKEIILSALEYRLLLVFANNRGHILTRSQLLEGIWDVSGDFVNDNTLTVYIKRLRNKLEDEKASEQIIKTVRGMGYIMN